ncbi:MAG: aspartyl/glutamyl-tRNA amidotransferase subunit A [Candidatus Aenigmarchaeota archaeon]|nr:aspartyl/glutamyl-tRNA amidotransferase subunit A [Candidatus Aenigmarchaeota archaeon]
MIFIDSLVFQHVRNAREGNIDFDDFSQKVIEKSEKIQKKYLPFVTLVEKPVKPEKKGKLFYLPISVKDCICTEGIQSSAGSKILKGYVPPFDATSVRKVRDEGVFILGKTNQDEFGFGTFSINSGYDIPRNPLDPERSAGGSSGGAACLTAVADFPHVALAESTGGSISSPAAFTGTVGLTPTYGRVSRWGLIDYANSMDKIGVIGKCVNDVALIFSAISGHDPLDSTSLDIPDEDFTKNLNQPIKGMKAGVPKEYFEEGVDEKIKKIVWQGIKKLENLGVDIKEVSLPHTKYSVASYYIIAVCEASTNLSKYCGMRYGLHEPLDGNFDEYFSKVREDGFGEEAKRRIILGTYARMAGYRNAYYLKALKVRTKIIEDFKTAFKNVDVLLAPSMPVIAPKFKEIEKLEPIDHYMMDILTLGPNLAGIPMLSVPCGAVNGMPVGMHILADHLKEKNIFKIASSFEKVKK